MAATVATAAVAARWFRRGLLASGRSLLASSDAVVGNRVSTPTLLWRSLRLLSTTPHSLRNAGPTSLPLGASVVEEVTVEGNRFVFETGKLARLADGCALFKTGDTHAMVTSVASRTLEEGKDFMPLQVEYRERMGAVGRIPSTFNRREGSPKDREILMMRAIDRPIRPLFPKGFFYETQVLASILCAEDSRETDVACINAASAALTLSDIPWGGPVLLTEIRQFSAKLHPRAQLEIYHGGVHVFQMFSDLDSTARLALRSAGNFIRQCASRRTYE